MFTPVTGVSIPKLRALSLRRRAYRQHDGLITHLKEWSATATHTARAKKQPELTGDLAPRLKEISRLNQGWNRADRSRLPVALVAEPHERVTFPSRRATHAFTQ